MSIASSELLMPRLSTLRAARYLKDHGIISDIDEINIPVAGMSNAEHSKSLLHPAIRHYFPGCRVRANADRFLLRLDSEINRKALAVRETVLRERTWSAWFRSNHSEIFELVNREESRLSSSGLSYDRETVKDEDGNDILRETLQFRFDTNSWRHETHHFVRLFETMREIRTAQHATARRYIQVNELVEQEKERREEEKRRRIEQEKAEYIAELKARLLKPITGVDRSSITAEGKFRVKMQDWCTEAGIDPVYAVEATDELVIPVGTKSRIMNRPGESDKDWFAAPMFGGFEVPEGFQYLPNWSKVTGYDRTGDRSLGGTAPIVLNEYIYLSFDINLWKQAFPENYDVILEATNRLRALAEAEFTVEEAQRQEEARRKREMLNEWKAREDAMREEMEQRIVEAKADFKKEYLSSFGEDSLTSPSEPQSPPEPAGPKASLKASVGMTKEEADAMMSLREQIKSSAQKKVKAKKLAPTILEQLSTIEHLPGLYRNDRAVPWERYVWVDDSMKHHTYGSREAMIVVVKTADSSYTQEYIRNYLKPDEHVEGGI